MTLGLERLAPQSVETPENVIFGPLEAFLASAVDSEHTRRAYRRHIRAAFTIMAVSRLSALELGNLVAYRETLLADGRGDATHAQALYALRSFLNWSADLGGLRLPARTAERLLRVPQTHVERPYVTITGGEAQALLESAAENLRDQALLLVMLGGGLRVSEVTGLNCADLVQVDGAPVLHVRKGKGNKDRLVPVQSEVELAIHRYLSVTARRLGESGPLFLSEDNGALDPARKEGQRLTPFGIRKILHKHVLSAGLAKRIPPHALRHTFGMAYQRKAKDLNLTAKMMGHASVATTQRYADHLQLAELRGNVPVWTSDEPALAVAPLPFDVLG